MILLLGAFVGSMFVGMGVGLAVVGLASLVVKAHNLLPVSVVVPMCHLFHFLFALTHASFKLVLIVVLFLYNVLAQCLGCMWCIFPCLFHFISSACSFMLWVGGFLVRGLLGLETKVVNTLSWLIAICLLFLYLESKLQELGLTRLLTPFNQQWSFWRTLIRRRRTNNAIHTADRNNNNAAAVPAEPTVQPGQMQILQENQLLEIENRENENEENALEEADRNQVHIDNVQNDQRELDRDRVDQAAPAAPNIPAAPTVAPEDSSDDEIDPNMCSVCLHRVRGVALFPCGHTQLCRICARIIMAAQRPCPICQSPIRESRNIYL